MDLSETFDTLRGLNQGFLFNCVLKSVLQKAQAHCNGTIFQKFVQLLAYADNNDITGRIKWDVTVAFCTIERESTKKGLAANESKTKYMLLRQEVYCIPDYGR